MGVCVFVVIDLLPRKRERFIITLDLIDAIECHLSGFLTSRENIPHMYVCTNTQWISRSLVVIL